MHLFVVLFVVGIPSVAPELHSLTYFYTGSSQVPNLPEFVAVGLVDDVQFEYYDSNTRRTVPKQDWMNKVTEDDAKYWEEKIYEALGMQQFLKTYIGIVKQYFGQTGGVHTYQRISGCEWNDESDEVTGFERHSYDGEDFISLDLTTETWITHVPQAAITKHKWDTNKAYMAYKKHYYTQICPEWLKKYVNFGKSSLMRKEFPSVSLLQKTPSSPVTCHATGFYPHRANLFWKRDEEELHEEVDRGEILPNHDGTFQMSVVLDLSSVKAEDWWRYSCVFHLAGVKEDVFKPLDKDKILTNQPPELPVNAEFLLALVAGVIGVVLGAAVRCAIVSFTFGRHFRGYRRLNKVSEPSSASGDPVMLKRIGVEQSLLRSTA